MKVYTVSKAVEPYYSDEEKYQRLLEGVPRTGLPPFLAEFHRMQDVRAIVEAKKQIRRKRYLRRVKRVQRD